MNKNSTKLNYIYNLLYQIFYLLTPFITTPYVSRVLGAAGVGRYSYCYSIEQYFVLFANLGFTYYAQREIAKYQNDKQNQSLVFWEICIARLLSTSISVFVFVIGIVTGLFGEYTDILKIMLISVVGNALDITFLFQGNNEFRFVAIRNILIRGIGILLIFLFVKDENDLPIYVGSQVIMLWISNLSLWTRIRMVQKVKLKELNIRKHIGPTLKLFLPTIAVSVYTILDKTLIGILIDGTIETKANNGEILIKKISDLENGYYEQSEKIAKMAMTLFTSLSTVLITKNTADLAQGKKEAFIGNVYNTIRYLGFIGIPIALGLGVCSSLFTSWFFGPGFEKTSGLISIFSPIVLILGLSNILGRQYLIPLQRDNEFTIAICFGAALNLILNILVIPKYYSYGAAIASICAELCVTVIMFVYSRKDITIKKTILLVKKYIIAGLIMFISLFILKRALYPSIISTVICVVTGAILYFGTLWILKDEYLLYALNIMKKHLKIEGKRK